MDEEIDTRKARDIVQAWMNQNDVTASELAQAADLDRAVIHRFLQYARPMQLRTAVRIYSAVHTRVDEATRVELRTALGLQEIAQLLNRNEITDLSESRFYPPGKAKAVSQIAFAIHLSQTGHYGKAADIFQLAIEALPASHELAMYSTCERVRCLIEIGCFNTARNEVTQITSRFGHNSGAEGMLRLLSLRLRLAYDLGDLANAGFLFRKLAFEADLHHHTARRSEAMHYGALLRLAIAMRTADLKRRDIHVVKAMRLFRIHDEYEKHHADTPIAAGLRALRWSEIHRTRRAEEDARVARRQARKLLRNTSSMHAVYIEMAKIALDRDQLNRSRTLALEARQIAADADLGLGVVHASYILAIADIMEDKLASALDHTIIAATLAPSWCYEDGTTTLEFMRHTVRSVVASLEISRRSSFELALRDRIAERRGPFAVLHSLRAANDRTPLHIYGQTSI